MTYKEAWFVVRVWTHRQTAERLPELKPSFLRDIADLRVYHKAIYREIRDCIEIRPKPAPKNPYRPQALGKVTTYAALQQRIARERGDA